ncbi:MAG TPA: hypothetical protein VKK06_01460 [Terriglobia bacterium]|jgi:hypothetical protein|nr:hypothetical protein [Terriglobia bacterium]
MKMRIGFKAWILIGAALVAGLLVSRVSSKAQAPAAQAYRAPRTADGKPNLNGIWQALNEANWDLEPHAAAQGTVLALGAQFSIPPGTGVVDGGSIPYKPEALAKKKDNFANRLKLDPEVKCYMGGVPRSTYMPYPFQIIQGKDTIMIAYEFAGAVRVINMGKPSEAPTDSWMGWSNGRWEGETLVIDVTGLNDQTWFDRAGNYHSDALHVVERYTPRSPDTLMYEATIEDPNVFSRPWKISMPLYRRAEKNAQIMEYKCPEFAEEALYGHLRKNPVKGDLR